MIGELGVIPVVIGQEHTYTYYLENVLTVSLISLVSISVWLKSRSAADLFLLLK